MKALEEYIKERNIGEDSLEADSIREGYQLAISNDREYASRELTWQDVATIVRIADDIVTNFVENHDILTSEESYYRMVLELFNKQRN